MWGAVLMSVLIVAHVATPQDYCSVNSFPNAGAGHKLTFSKELSQAEFAYVGSFKSLHCCANSFRTVEWFKSGQPYPWTGNVSSFIINPASHNQTIYSQAVSQGDSGDYHCLVSNGTYQLNHHVHLTVTSSGFVGPPIATYTPQDQYRKIGDSARFYCEAYVGNIQLPDARSDVLWTRVHDNFTQDSNARHKQTLVAREDKQIYGSYLSITNIQPEDFGMYYCVVSNTGDQFLQLSMQLYESKGVSEDWTDSVDTTVRVCLGVGFACALAIIILITTYRFRLQITLMWKVARKRLHFSPEEEVDVTMLYHEQDGSTALAYIAPTLQHRYFYSCICCQLTNDIQWRKLEIGGKRLLVTVSHHLTQNSWTVRSVSDILQTLLKLHPKVICIFLDELPAIDIRTEEGRSLKESLAKVHYITQAEVQDNNFWTRLQLGMPQQKKSSDYNKTADSLENLM